MEKTRILLADDHAVVRAGIRKVVEEIPGLEVVAEAGDGPLLLEHLARERPDFLLVDISMPDFDPIKTISAIRTRYPGMKILVVSAYDDEFYVHGLLGAGVDGYHLKDQPLSDLKLALQQIMAGERWISSPLISKLVGGGRPAPAAPLLTARQRDILRLLQEGLDNQSIALEMSLSVKTIENHLTRIYRQLQVRSRLEAVNYVSQHPEVLGVMGQRVLQKKTAEIPRSKGIAILVIDDNPRYLGQIQRVLGRVYPQAVLYEADSIIVAVRLARQIQPRLVFVDVVLGEEDGIRCARRIKAVSEGSRIIMISAYPDHEFHRLSMEAGAVAFLDKKDLDAATLRQVINDVSC
ncbi:MAG: response regulator [Anaerolineales bacterium]